MTSLLKLAPGPPKSINKTTCSGTVRREKTNQSSINNPNVSCTWTSTLQLCYRPLDMLQRAAKDQQVNMLIHLDTFDKYRTLGDLQ